MNSDIARSTDPLESTTDADITNGVLNLGISKVNDLQITCFSDEFNDITLHFQIIRLPKQVSTLTFSTSMNSDIARSTDPLESTTDADITNGLLNLGISKVNDLQITCFSDEFNDITLHFQIIRLPKQIYAWIGCNSAKFGHLYAAAPTRPNNTVSVSSLLGGSSDNTGSGIARRIVIKTGIPVTLACNIPKDSPMLEAAAEKKLVQKLSALGYTKSKHQNSSS